MGATKQTGVTLEQDVKDLLDRYAKANGLKKCWIINQALRRYLGMDHKGAR